MDSPQGTVIFCVNNSSGAGWAGYFHAKMCEIGASRDHIICRSLSEVSPYDLLRQYVRNGRFVFPSCTVVACGGDGTGSWLAQTFGKLHSEGVRNLPKFAILPFGTGNDLSRHLVWGTRWKGRDVKKLHYGRLVSQMVRHPCVPLDIWACRLSPRTAAPRRFPEFFCNYIVVGFPAEAAVLYDAYRRKLEHSRTSSEATSRPPPHANNNNNTLPSCQTSEDLGRLCIEAVFPQHCHPWEVPSPRYNVLEGLGCSPPILHGEATAASTMPPPEPAAAAGPSAVKVKPSKLNGRRFIVNKLSWVISGSKVLLSPSVLPPSLVVEITLPCLCAVVPRVPALSRLPSHSLLSDDLLAYVSQNNVAMCRCGPRVVQLHPSRQVFGITIANIAFGGTQPAAWMNGDLDGPPFASASAYNLPVLRRVDGDGRVEISFLTSPASSLPITFPNPLRSFKIRKFRVASATRVRLLLPSIHTASALSSERRGRRRQPGIMEISVDGESFELKYAESGLELDIALQTSVRSVVGDPERAKMDDPTEK